MSAARWIAILLFALVGVAVAILIAVAVVAENTAGDSASAVRGALLPLVGAGILVTLIIGTVLWGLLRGGMLKPVAMLGRDIRTLLQAKRVDRPLRLPESHMLGDLPEAVSLLADELRGTRREVVRAMATATARVEQEKGWLEHVLLELVPNGVVVCNLEHRILLYNRSAATLFRESPALGLGRSMLDLVTREPLNHALESLELKLKTGRRYAVAPFVCATKERARMLHARMALVQDPARGATGYALILEDISTRLEGGDARAQIHRALTRDIRGPLASLRAAAETLSTEPSLSDEERRSFEQIIASESNRLSQQVETLAEVADELTEHEWPMAEIHSPDLVSCAARQVEQARGIQLRASGDPAWLTGDSHLLMATLVDLTQAIAAREGVSEIAVKAGKQKQRGFFELEWRGKPIPEGVLEEWLAKPLELAPDTTGKDALERHASEPWSRAGTDGAALLHIPLQSASAPEASADGMTEHPELYDFDLMYARSFTGDLGDRKLAEVAYVVFDTETTGLRPAAGDEIISIAGVRVTQGRVLASEAFECLVNPGRPIPKDSIRFHGITDDMVREKAPITAELPRFREFAGDAVLVAHNAAFDMKFIKLRESECGVEFDNPVIDTLLLSLLVDGPDEDHTLDGICDRLGVRIVDRHSALGDAMATAHVLVHLLERLAARNIYTFNDVMKATNMREELRVRGHGFEQL